MAHARLAVDVSATSGMTRVRTSQPITDHFEISPPFIPSPASAMGKKAAKSTRKFAASGQLKKVIQARHKHQRTKKEFEKRRGNKGKSQLPAKVPELDEDEDEEVEEAGSGCVLGLCILLSC